MGAKRDQEILSDFTNTNYKYGFVSELESDTIKKGLNESVIKMISKKKNEPKWMLENRLSAFNVFKNMTLPEWANIKIKELDLQDISYYSAPKKSPKYNSLDEVDPEILKTFNKLGISIDEQKRLSGVAVDVVIDSVSVATSFKDTLAELGIIFCSMSEAIKNHPSLVKKYIGTVVPAKDNYFAALNSAVFSDGSFCYIPPGVKCPMELSTYFRINEAGTGQFERTLIIAEKDSYVSYLEGCTAPSRDENQLHAAIVELVAMESAEIKYSTVQNWYPGDKDGNGGVYNFVTKRGVAYKKAKISWTQVETGSAITWKYPSCILKGDDSIGEFFSIAITLLSLITIPFGWVMPSFNHFMILSLIGIFGGVSNLWLSQSYKYSEVSLVTPLKYLTLVFAIIFGYFIWDEIPTIKTLIGAFLVITSTLIIFRREIYKKKNITSKVTND